MNLGYTFELPYFDKAAYELYIQTEVFLKAVIQQPVPPEVGKLHFTVNRNAGMLSKLTPSYTLYLEKYNDQRY